MATKRKTEKTDKAEPRALTEWEWATLVAAWRYYEHRATAMAATFPAEIVRHCFSSSSPYTYFDQKRIAYQFAVVDHGLRGERDWEKADLIDARPWCKFFAFCRAFAGDCISICSVRGIDYPVFRCQRTGRVYPIDQYLANPDAEIFVNEEDALGTYPYAASATQG